MSSPEEATDILIDRLRAIAACVTDRLIAGTGFRSSATAYHAGFLPRGEPASLRTETSNRRVLLDASIDYRVTPSDRERGAFEARIVGYVIDVLDPSGRELITWHWHPTGSSGIAHTHAHLSSRIQPIELGRGLEPLPLADLHIPTGYVDLADVVRFLIAEVGIRPRKRDWEAILAREI